MVPECNFYVITWTKNVIKTKAEGNYSCELRANQLKLETFKYVPTGFSSPTKKRKEKLRSFYVSFFWSFRLVNLPLLGDPTESSPFHSKAEIKTENEGILRDKRCSLRKFTPEKNDPPPLDNYPFLFLFTVNVDVQNSKWLFLGVKISLTFVSRRVSCFSVLHWELLLLRRAPPPASEALPSVWPFVLGSFLDVSAIHTRFQVWIIVLFWEFCSIWLFSIVFLVSFKLRSFDG